MTPTNEYPCPRPYWHADAKWISGILLVCALGVALLTFNLAQITGPEQATAQIGSFLTLTFAASEAEAQNPTLAQRLQESLAAAMALPGLRDVLGANDVLGLLPRQATSADYAQLANALYQWGARDARAQAEALRVPPWIAQSATAFGLYTARTHRVLQRLTLVLGLLAVFLCVPLVSYSHRYGKLGSPGIAILAASLPGALAFLFLEWAMQRIAPNPQVAGIAILRLPYAVSSTLLLTVQAIAQNYLIVAAIGLALIVLALVASLLDPPKRYI